jgi:hypothetical protein
MPIWSIYIRCILLLLSMFESVVVIVVVIVTPLYFIYVYDFVEEDTYCIASWLDFIQTILCKANNILLLCQSRIDLSDDLQPFRPLFFRVVNDMNANIIVESDPWSSKLLK